MSAFTTVAETALTGSRVERVREVFGRLLGAAHGGMSFSVYRQGEPLLRLHGGSFERRESPEDEPATPWDETSMAVMFSGTKGLVATLTALTVDRGELDVRAPVAHYWPEFAANGKERVTVAQILDHTVGLLYTDPEPAGGMLDIPAHTAVLAEQRPLWEPGTRVAYHAVTWGYLVEELLLRITGRRAGELLREQVARPCGLDLHLGLSDQVEPRVSPVFQAPGYTIGTFLPDTDQQDVLDRMYGRGAEGAMSLPNTRAYHASGLASGAGIAGADAIARFYSLVACGELLSPDTLELFTRTWSSGTDEANGRPVAFGLGYELQDSLGNYGPVERAYGHSGAGGSVHGVWPHVGIGFSFHTNEMFTSTQDRRAKDLLAALAECDLG